MLKVVNVEGARTNVITYNPEIIKVYAGLNRTPMSRKDKFPEFIYKMSQVT